MTNKYQEESTGNTDWSTLSKEELIEQCIEDESFIKQLASNYLKQWTTMEKAVDKMAYLLANTEKDSCYYCPLLLVENCSVEELKKKCIATGKTNNHNCNCTPENWKEWAFRDDDYIMPGETEHHKQRGRTAPSRGKE